ncbi:MAG: DMT family transporter [Bacteroidales bacterium]|nr:DMT family transporter [Bacteroidales bacterium]
MSKQRNIATGHLAAFGAYLIFGLNVVFCKDMANSGSIEPGLLFGIRSLIAAGLFWAASAFIKREALSWRDLLAMAGAALLGLVIPQMTFLYAITMTAPITLSVVNSITPIVTMFLAAIFLREPITWKKALGVAVSFGGVVWLIMQRNDGTGNSSTLGVLLCVVNSVSFACYLGTCRPLIKRYNSVNLMKWMFTVAFLATLPQSLWGLGCTDLAAVPPSVWWEVAYLVFFATFVAYFLIPVAQQRIRPTLVSMYGYMQPVIAAVVGVWMGMDSLTWTKAAAALLVFAGVYIVNRSRAAAG